MESVILIHLLHPHHRSEVNIGPQEEDIRKSTATLCSRDKLAMADMHLPPQAFPDASSILGPYLELSDQGIGKLRNHSRSHEFSVYDNTDPVKLLEVTAEESVALATNCKAEDHFFDLPPDEHLPASMFTDPIERLDPEIEHDDSAFACAFASAMDPVHLYALQKGGIKYWEKNNVRMNAVVERVTEAEEKMNAPLAREGAKKLRRYRKTWTRLQEICTEARHEKREAVRQRWVKILLVTADCC